ncbi:hypothetical protein J4208_02285 [Candidatus Woesearchaeota archaeon]|nr:hypothetical protein [Candidatus Woesearchaeota archaeon]
MKTLFFLFSFLILLVSSCTSNGQVIIEKNSETQKYGSSFTAKENDICMIGGKPIIREFATSWCPHCAWVKPTFQEVIKSYGDQIVAYQWEVDKGDNLLTEELEFEVPASEMNVFREFNPKQSIPTFIIGCKYMRIGNAFEEQNDKEAEAKELKAIIDKILNEVSQQ